MRAKDQPDREEKKLYDNYNYTREGVKFADYVFEALTQIFNKAAQEGYNMRDARDVILEQFDIVSSKAIMDAQVQRLGQTER